jgi:mono/diheme cytochrome c family protein
MYNNKILAVYSTTILTTLLLLISFTANSAEGDKLFQQYCARCHQTATAIKTTPDVIVNVFTSGTIRQHRFNLDDDTLEAIVSYIKQVNS